MLYHLGPQLDHMELIKALMVFGADVEVHNDLGETPGLIAARTSKGENVFKLFQISSCTVSRALYVSVLHDIIWGVCMQA